MSGKDLDSYTHDAENKEITPQKKIDGLKALIKETKTAMFTTRTATGELHSRAMTPCAPHHHDTGLHFLFFGNNTSHKFDEIKVDEHVNVSFYNHSTTDWASVAGKAKITQDKKLIHEHWSSFISAYYNDLGDGVHTGKEDDPRVCIIEVIPDEIRYWVATSGSVGRAMNVAVGAVTGHSHAPGELRTLSYQEIQLVEGLHQVK